MTRILVVLPAYDEEGGLPPLLASLERALRDHDHETIVVDDGSRDGTARVLAEHAPRMKLTVERHARNQGLGPTVRDGLRLAAQRAAPEDVIVVMDADDTHPAGLIPSMVRCIEEGNDVVIASRYRQGAHVAGLSPLRRAMSSGASLLFRATFPIPGVRDYTCGFRAYRAAVIQGAFRSLGDGFVDQQGFQCMVDILIKLQRQGAICRELPLVLRYDRKVGRSKMNVGRTVVRTLGLLARRRLGR